MKIAIVTWSTYNNYGTLLQAFALQNYIQRLNFSCEIISDKFIIEKTTNCKAQNNENDGNKINRIKKYLANPKEALKILKIKLRKKKYFHIWNDSNDKTMDFRNHLLKINYDTSFDNLSSISGLYDIFVCGSDQIWSSIIKYEGFYFLNFTSKKKIAYAPSMSSDAWSEEFVCKLKRDLKDFTALSTRENTTSLHLSGILNRDVKHVCDPTLLFQKNDWEAFCSKIQNKKRKYLLCYFLENKTEYFDYAKNKSKELGLKLMLIPSCPAFTISKYCIKEAVGPLEFVSLFRDASYVLTDSFHGTIFSLIFEKQAGILKRFEDGDPNNQNIRIISLLQTLGYNDVFTEDVFQLDSKKVKERLDKHREESQYYLRVALGVQ